MHKSRRILLVQYLTVSTKFTVAEQTDISRRRQRFVSLEYLIFLYYESFCLKFSIFIFIIIHIVGQENIGQNKVPFSSVIATKESTKSTIGGIPPPIPLPSRPKNNNTATTNTGLLDNNTNTFLSNLKYPKLLNITSVLSNVTDNSGTINNQSTKMGVVNPSTSTTSAAPPSVSLFVSSSSSTITNPSASTDLIQPKVSFLGSTDIITNATATVPSVSIPCDEATIPTTSSSSAVTLLTSTSHFGLLTTKLDLSNNNGAKPSMKFNASAMKMPTLKKPSLILPPSVSSVENTPTGNPEEIVTTTTTTSSVEEAFILPSAPVPSNTKSISVDNVPSTEPNTVAKGVKKSNPNRRKSSLPATTTIVETSTISIPASETVLPLVPVVPEATAMEMVSSQESVIMPINTDQPVNEISLPLTRNKNRKSLSSTSSLSRRDSTMAVRTKGNHDMDEEDIAPVVISSTVTEAAMEVLSSDVVLSNIFQPSARKFHRRRKSGLPSPAEQIAHLNAEEKMDTDSAITEVPVFSLAGSVVPTNSVISSNNDDISSSITEITSNIGGVRRNARRRSAGTINGSSNSAYSSNVPTETNHSTAIEPALQLSDLETVTEETKTTMETVDVPSIVSLPTVTIATTNIPLSPNEKIATKPTKGNGRRRRSAGTGVVLKLRSPVQTNDDDDWNLVGCTLEGGDDIGPVSTASVNPDNDSLPLVESNLGSFSANLSPLSEALAIARSIPSVSSSAVTTTTTSHSSVTSISENTTTTTNTSSKVGRKRTRALSDNVTASNTTTTNDETNEPKLNSLSSLSSQIPSLTSLSNSTPSCNLPPVVIPRTTSVTTESDYTTPRCGASRVIIKGTRTLREPEQITMTRISARLQAIMNSVSGIMYEPILNEIKKLIEEIDTSNTSVGKTFTLALRILASTSAPLATTNDSDNTVNKGKTPGKFTPRASRVKFAAGTPSTSSSSLLSPTATSKPFSDLTFFSPSRIYNQDSNFGPLLQEFAALGEFVRAVVNAERSSRSEIAAINERNIRRNEELNHRFVEARREKGIPEIDEDNIDEDDDDSMTTSVTRSTTGSSTAPWNPTASYAAMFVPKNGSSTEECSQDSTHSSPIRSTSNTSESEDSLDGMNASKLLNQRPNSLLGLIPPPQTPLRYASSLSSTSSQDDIPTPLREKKKTKTVRFSTFDFSSINAAPNDLSTSALPVPFNINRSPSSIRNGVSAGTALHNGARMRDIMEPGCVAFSLADACGAARKLRDVIHARGGLMFDLARERTYVRPLTVGDTTPVHGSGTDIPVAKTILVPFLQILLAVEACGNSKVWNTSMDKAITWYTNTFPSAPLSTSVATVVPNGVTTTTTFYSENWGEVKGVARYYVAQLSLLQSRNSPLPLVESLSNAVSSAIRYHLRRALNPHMYDDEETNEITTTRPNDPTITPPPNKFVHVDGPMPGHHHHHAHHGSNPATSSFGTASTLGMSMYNGGLSSSFCGGIGRGGGGIRQGFIAMAPNTGRLRYNGDDLAALTHRALMYVYTGHERITELIHPHTLQQEMEMTGPPKRRGQTSTATSTTENGGLTILQIVDGAHIADLEMMVNYAESHAFLRNLFGHESSLAAITADGECWKRLRMLSRIAAEYSCEMEAHLLPLSSVSNHIHALLSQAEVVDRVGYFANLRLDRHTKMLEEYRKKYFKSRNSSLGGANNTVSTVSSHSSSTNSHSSHSTNSNVNYHANDEDIHNDNHERPKKRKNSASRLASPAPADKRRYLELMGADEEEDVYPEPIPPMQLADKLAQVASNDSSSVLNLSGTDMDTSMENIILDPNTNNNNNNISTVSSFHSNDGLSTSLTSMLPLATPPSLSSPATTSLSSPSMGINPALPLMDPVTAARVAYLMEHEDILNRKLRFMYPRVQLYHCSADNKQVYDDQVVVTAPGFGGVPSIHASSSSSSLTGVTILRNATTTTTTTSNTSSTVLNLPGLGGLGTLNITMGTSSTKGASGNTVKSTTSSTSSGSGSCNGALSLSELMTVSDTIARPTTKQAFSSTIDNILNSSQINSSFSTSQSSFHLSSSNLTTTNNNNHLSTTTNANLLPPSTTALSNTSLAALSRLKSFTDQALTGSLPIATLPNSIGTSVPPFKLPIFSSVTPIASSTIVTDNSSSSSTAVPNARIPKCGECRLPITTVPPIAALSTGTTTTNVPTVRCTRCQVVYHIACVGIMENNGTTNTYRCQACVQSMNSKK